MLYTHTPDLGSVTITRIAGLAFDARHAAELRQTARIYSYTRHIRRLAEDAAPPARRGLGTAPYHRLDRVLHDVHRPAPLTSYS